MLTARQAAAYLAISAREIYELCKAGKLPHYRVGCKQGSLRLEQADLDAYKLRCFVPATPQPSPEKPKTPRRMAVGFEEGLSTLREYGFTRAKA